jgi:hypothetical protein
MFRLSHGLLLRRVACWKWSNGPLLGKAQKKRNRLENSPLLELIAHRRGAWLDERAGRLYT